MQEEVDASPASPTSDITIVGVGASAGGLEVFSELLENLPGSIGLALVLVPHLAPKFESALPDLLTPRSLLPVVQVVDGMRIERDKVYVIPPNAHMELADGCLRLIPRPDDKTQYTPIDHFLRSLAEYAGSRAIAVILSGTASDGAVGVREVKAVGGITIAQDPETARYDGMPRAAIATGTVDLVLTPRHIAQELVRIARHPYVSAVQPRAAGEPEVTEGQLHRIFTLLRQASGVDFTHYKPPTIRRRLHRRMVLHKIGGVEEYIKFLEAHPPEIQKLFQDILINVTRFFRDPQSFLALESTVFPNIIESRRDDSPIRLWVPGCSTGEEAYSLCIALLDHLGENASGTPIQMFATDVSEAAIEHARTGVYPESIAADVSPERLRRYFSKVDGNYRISKSVRELCVFARQDITRDPPFSRLDLIVCRNVLIYLGAPLQRKLIEVFHYALRPSGHLMLGSAETVGPQTDLFTIADKKHRIYRKRPGDVPQGMMFPIDYTAAPQERSRRAHRPPLEQTTLQNEANRIILDKYGPPAVVVDGELQIVLFRGQTGAYLEPAPGEASLNLLKMAREGLLYALRTAVYEARRTQEPVRKAGLRVRSHGQTQTVDIEVIPFANGSGTQYLLIAFIPSQSAEAPAGAEATARSRSRKEKTEDQRVAQLQHELAASREYLQSIIQDLEAANEELQSANEEVLSSNEELQSTNEELDTAKEELQSTNEELNTVNEELHGRNEEMSRVNSDLINLLASVNIAIVMVAGDLRIRRFTPMAERVLNLIPADIGRPIGHIKPNIDCPDLEKHITEVIDSVSTRELDLRDRQGSWFSLRIRPYKNLENRIDGAVLALIDVNTAKKYELEMRAATEYTDAMMQVIREPILVLDADLRVRRVNQSFCSAFGLEQKDVTGRLLWELGEPGWATPEVRSRLEDSERSNPLLEEFPLERTLPRLGRRKLILNAQRVDGTEERPGVIILSIRDATETDRTNT